MWRWVLDLVVCPMCRGALAPLELSPDGRDGVLGHADGPCDEVYPVIGAVTRLLVGPARASLHRERADWFATSPYGSRFSHWSGTARDVPPDLRLVARFDREWHAFTRVGTPEQQRIFASYFEVVPPELLGEGHIALDAGCGGGRWAFEVQRGGSRVLAIDLGCSVEIAERNTRESGRVACLQADVRDLPVRSAAVDLAYSLGVLHHIEPTAEAVRDLAAIVRPGGALLLYLYYALDGRRTAYRALFRASDAVRMVATKLPQPLLVGLSTVFAACVYLPLARLALALRSIGARRFADALPLSFYANLSFETMRNDSLDRFGTRLEKRFTRVEVHRLLEDAGLHDIVVSNGPPYWHAVGRTPSAAA